MMVDLDKEINHYRAYVERFKGVPIYDSLCLKWGHYAEAYEHLKTLERIESAKSV